MRLEATVPDSRGQAVEELARELGMSNSRVVDEALALFLKAVLEVRRGRRIMTMDAAGSRAAVELSTPTLAALEWALQPESLSLPPKALARMHAVAADQAKPGSRLKAAVKAHGKRKS